jgi:hypothetical protein
MKTEPQRTCPSCGNEFSGAMEFCPVCMLRKGLAGGVESGESSFQEAIQPASDQPPKRFEHYELSPATRRKINAFSNDGNLGKSRPIHEITSPRCHHHF